MKSLVLVFILLSGCASLRETALPRASNALDGLKSFYFAVCMVPPSGKEAACEKGREAVNGIGEFYNSVNEAVGEDD